MAYKLPDLNIEDKTIRSKYRVIINSMFEYFENNPTIRITKIECEYGADADNLAKKIKLWLKKDEELYVVKKDNIVYFLRDDDG